MRDRKTSLNRREVLSGAIALGGLVLCRGGSAPTRRAPARPVGPSCSCT